MKTSVEPTMPPTNAASVGGRVDVVSAVSIWIPFIILMLRIAYFKYKIKFYRECRAMNQIQVDDGGDGKGLGK